MIFLNIARHRQSATRLTCCLQASRSSACSLHISFQLSPVHSFTSSNHLQAFLLIFPLNCTLQDGVPFALSRVTTCSNNLNFLFLTISSSVSYFPMCSPTLLCMSTLHGRHSMRVIMHDVWRQCVKRVSWAFFGTF